MYIEVSFCILASHQSRACRVSGVAFSIISWADLAANFFAGSCILSPNLLLWFFLGVFFYWAWCSSKAVVYSDKILEIIYGVFHVLYFDLSLSQLRVNETALKVIGLFLQITAVDTPTICQTCRKAGRSLRNMGSTQVALNSGLFSGVGSWSCSSWTGPP